MCIESKDPLGRSMMKEAANGETKIIYLSSNGTDDIKCLFYHGITFPCQTLSYIMRWKCTNGIGDKIIIHVLWNEIPIIDCEWDDYLKKFSRFNRFGPHCDLEIFGTLEGSQMPTFDCLNSSEGRQNLPLSNRHIEFTNGYDYYGANAYDYSHSNYDYQDTGGNAYSGEEFPMPKFRFSNLKFVGIIIDLTSIDAVFEQAVFENSMIQHFSYWEYDCYISFHSCTFSRTRDDIANFGYPSWIPDYVKHFKSMSGIQGYAPNFIDGFLLGPWPHSPIFMERCKSVKFSMTNTSWVSGTIAIFYQQNAEINITSSTFTNSEPFQTFIWIDDLSLMHFEMNDKIDRYYACNTTIRMSDLVYRDIQNNKTNGNAPNILRVTSKSNTLLHVSNSMITNTSGFLYIYLRTPINGFGEILFTNNSFIENVSPTSLVKFSRIFVAHIKIAKCIFKNNQALDGKDTRILDLFNGKQFYIHEPTNDNGLGSALHVNSQPKSFIIQNCTFLDNISHRGGGALHVGTQASWQKILYVQDSYFQCCDTTVKLKSGYIISGESGLKLTNVTIFNKYSIKKYVPMISFKSVWEPLSMTNTHITCSRGNEIETNVKDVKTVIMQYGFYRFDVACTSCSYPGFNNKLLHASYYDYDHEVDHDRHNETFAVANNMNVFKYYPKARIIEELENTQCSTGNCPFGAVCEGLLIA